MFENDTNDSQKYIYDLSAILCHTGGSSIKCGYYVVYCRENELWYLYDDEKVFQVNLDIDDVNYTNCCQTAYLLFYDKKIHQKNTEP